MNRLTRWRGIALAAAAFGGTLVGHWVAYRLGVHGHGHRVHVLAATGHGYWLTAVKLALGLGLVGAAVAFVSGFRTTALEPPGFAHRYSGLLARLAILQVVAFFAMETTERLSAGAPLGGMFAQGLLLLGVSVQFLVAGLGALALSLLWRAGRSVARALRGTSGLVARPVLRPVPWERAGVGAVIGLLSGAAGVRGPPSS